MQGVHSIKVDGKSYKAIGRFKENTKASNWQYLDRDVDIHTPAEFANLNYASWIAKVGLLLPGLAGATRIQTLSSSARVTKSRKALGSGNGHTWVQFQDNNDVERVRSALKVKAMEVGLSWKKPRYSNADPHKVVGQGFATIVDASVLTPGRLVFIGKPTAGPGLVVKRQIVTVVEGTRLDTSRLVMPAADRLKSITRAAGFEMQIKTDDGGGLSINTQDLTLDLEIELGDGTVTTVRDALMELGDNAKIRCQTPFRASNSMAAFLSRGSGGKPFLHDVGTSTTHWLNDGEAIGLGHNPLSENGVPLKELLEHLAPLTAEDLLAQWASPALHLGAHDREKLIDYVIEKAGATRRVLNAVLKEATNRRKTAQVQEKAANRELILYTPEDLTKQSAETEQLILASATDTEYLSFGGVLSQLLDKEVPYTHLIGDPGGAAPKVPLLELFDEYGMRAMVERVAVFQKVTQLGVQNIGVPAKIIETLIRKKLHAAPIVTGLLTHPIVLLDGTIVSEDGLHRRSGLLLHGSSVPDARPYTQVEARRALKRLKISFLEGFEFETDLDATVALTALVTGVVRRVLDQAPGFAAVAPIQSSGKTTLARRIHLVLTGRDMPVSNFAAGDEKEMQARMLSTLLSSPAMICLDNVTDGSTFSSSAISMVMTSPVLKQRVLGISKDAEVPTNVLLVATGNNLSLGADELTRWLPAYLNPRTARPQERTFAHPDVVTHALGMRADLLRDVIGIIAGYIASGTTMPIGSRFSRWDRMVRQPVVWAGGGDVADVFRANSDNSEANGAAAALLTALKAIYGAAEFSAGQIAGRIELLARDTKLSELSAIKEALIALRCKDPRSDASVGRALKSIVKRRVPTPEGDLTLICRQKGGLSRYKVV